MAHLKGAATFNFLLTVFLPLDTGCGSTTTNSGYVFLPQNMLYVYYGS